MIYRDNLEQLQPLADIVGDYSRLLEAINNSDASAHDKLSVAQMALRMAQKVEKELDDHKIGIKSKTT